MKLIIKENIKESLFSLLENKFIEGRIHIIVGKNISFRIAQILFKGLGNINIIKAVDDRDFIKFATSNISKTDIVIGVGGGVIVDISKEISYQTKSVLVLVPTVISNDGLASGLVVLKSVNNGKSIYRKSADYIFIDLTIIENAPISFLKSSIGELFSKFSAYNDWVYSNKKDDVSEISHYIKKSFFLFDDEYFLNIENIINSLMYSAKAINLQKDSSPASGSEHLLYHALYNNGMLDNVSHGIAVASISIFTLYLQNKLEQKHIEILQRIGIPIHFLQFNDISKTDLYFIFDYAKKYRKERDTILNFYSTSELIDKYSEFKVVLSNYKISI